MRIAGYGVILLLNQVGLIGPATVGGIKPGCMRIGNTGGMLDNIVMSKVRNDGGTRNYLDSI